jgi:hypothetical protein
MQRNIPRSIGAVLAGFLLIALLGFITDTVLQTIAVLPATGGVRFTDGQSLLALSYHLGFVILGSYVTARLAPYRQLAHSIALGALGAGFSALGLFAIIAGDLAPAWYGWALVLLSVPVCWIGGKLFLLQRAKAAS